MINQRKGSVTSTIGLMLVIMLSINIGLAMTQAGVNSLTDEGTTFFNDSNSPYNNYITGDIVNGDISLNNDYLPSDEAVTGDTGNIITDTYSSTQSWFKQKLEPLGFITNMFNQPRGFLLDIGIPNSIALPIQVLWGVIFLLFITAFIMGRT